MSRNGSGVYSLPAGNPVVTGTTISSTWANTTLSDIATALTGSVASDGQTAMTGNLQMGNNKITGLANGSSSTDALAFGQIAAGTLAGSFTTLSASGVATFSAGTVSAPAITTTGDTNTGIFFPAADTIAFAEGGAEAMRINSSGNVGIGTNNPSTKLSVVTGAGTNAIQATDGTNADFFVDFPATAYTRLSSKYFTQGGFIFSSGSGNTEFMRLDLNGNLGLGVTPSAWYSALNTKVIQFGTVGAVVSVSKDVFLSNNQYSNSVGTDTYLTTGGAALQYRQTTGGQHQWYTAPSGTAGNAITFTQAMTLDASGRLGIGTTSPATRLHIASAGTTATQVQNTASTASAYFEAKNTGTSSYFGVDVNGGYIETAGAYSTVFYTNGSERMRIDTSGNLLVGATGSIGGTCRVGSYFDGNTINGMNLRDSYAGTGGYFIGFYNSSNTFCGGVNHNGTATVSYVTSSDYRLKDNQAPLTGSGAFIDALKPKTWTWTADGSTGVGFIAHEVQEVSPTSVVGEKDAVNEDGSIKAQGMEYGSAEFIANIVAELQDLRKRVSALENK